MVSQSKDKLKSSGRGGLETIQMGKSTLNMNLDSSSPSLKLNPEPARTSHLAPPICFHIIHVLFIFVIKQHVYFILIPVLLLLDGACILYLIFLGVMNYSAW